MLYLYLQAPFAAFRTFTAGSFRPTAGFITPSAAYGLLLNVAGIEMRSNEGKEVMTLIKRGLPCFKLALGALKLPREQTIYQQLHNYPIGTTGKEHAPRTKGSKYNVVPARRAFLCDVRAYICIDADPAFEAAVADGLAGCGRRDYGLPFLGDNSFLIDRLEVVAQPSRVRWFELIGAADDDGFRDGITRLTITIDRKDIPGTRSSLFAPSRQATTEVPEAAWVDVGYP